MATGEKIWMAKHLSGFSATGRVMFRRGEWKHSNCPRCGQHNEDAQHIIRCTAPPVIKGWEEAISQFTLNLEKDTDPSLLRAIVQSLKVWKHSIPEYHLPYTDTIIKAIEDQRELGWEQFAYGRCAVSWKDAQQEWLNHKATRWRSSASKWMTKLATAAKEIAWTMWENRNNWLHDDSHPWKQADQRFIMNEIPRLYNSLSSPHLLPRDRKLLKTPLLTIKTFSPSKQNLWFQAVQAALARKRISEERSLRRAHLNDIRRYFQPTQSHPS